MARLTGRIGERRLQMNIGTIGWIDLTVENAGEIRDFYRSVAGWSVEEVQMDGYQDYCMSPPGGEGPVAGICHARGGNSGLPPGWLIYITVEDLEQSVARCLSLGGEVRVQPKSAGDDRYCVIRDPSGACCALYQKGGNQ
jgi:predicted enzyme related to lactoylglutathione lyase